MLAVLHLNSIVIVVPVGLEEFNGTMKRATIKQNV